MTEPGEQLLKPASLTAPTKIGFASPEFGHFQGQKRAFDPSSGRVAP
jgi:hypothetical protein